MPNNILQCVHLTQHVNAQHAIVNNRKILTCWQDEYSHEPTFVA